MDKMSLFSILAVSVPESILSIYLAFLLTGEKIHLFLDDKVNIIRLCTAVPLMVITYSVLRASINNLLLVILINMIITGIILKVVYSLSWNKAVVSVLVIFGSIVTMEAIYTPIFMQVTGMNADKLLADDGVRFIFSLTERATQLFVILVLWNWNKVSFNLKDYKEVRPVFLVFVSIVLLTQIIFLTGVFYTFDKLTLIFKIIYPIGCFMFAIFYFMLFKFTSVLTNAVLKREMTSMMTYKSETKNSFNAIREYLEKGDIENAKRMCENIAK